MPETCAAPPLAHAVADFVFQSNGMVAQTRRPLVMAAGNGLLIAAKSVRRFGAVADDRRVSEHVITGTLASFAWAIAAAFATRSLREVLPALGIPALSP